MTYTTNTDKANIVLQNSKNHRLQIQGYSKISKKITILLDWFSDKEPITIHALDCEEMTGCFDYDKINLHITQQAGITKITDAKAGFELIALGGFVLVKGRSEDFIDLHNM